MASSGIPMETGQLNRCTWISSRRLAIRWSSSRWPLLICRLISCWLVSCRCRGWLRCGCGCCARLLCSGIGRRGRYRFLRRRLWLCRRTRRAVALAGVAAGCPALDGFFASAGWSLSKSRRAFRFKASPGRCSWRVSPQCLRLANSLLPQWEKLLGLELRRAFRRIRIHLGNAGQALRQNVRGAHGLRAIGSGA